MFALAGEGKRGCGCQPHHHLMLGNSCPNTSGEESRGDHYQLQPVLLIPKPEGLSGGQFVYSSAG